MQNVLLMQGRWLRPEDVTGLRDWIQAHPQWSRKRLARELCERWDWRDATGRLKGFAARSLLLKLAARADLPLPALQVQQRRAPRAPHARAEGPPPSAWSAPLADDGSFALSYLPTKGTLTLDLAKLSGERVVASWFNPRTGESTRIGEFTDKQRRAFEPPSEGDWVLVVDDAAKRFPVPGTGVSR